MLLHGHVLRAGLQPCRQAASLKGSHGRHAEDGYRHAGAGGLLGLDPAADGLGALVAEGSGRRTAPERLHWSLTCWVSSSRRNSSGYLPCTARSAAARARPPGAAAALAALTSPAAWGCASGRWRVAHHLPGACCLARPGAQAEAPGPRAAGHI